MRLDEHYPDPPSIDVKQLLGDNLAEEILALIGSKVPIGQVYSTADIIQWCREHPKEVKKYLLDQQD